MLALLSLESAKGFLLLIVHSIVVFPFVILSRWPLHFWFGAVLLAFLIWCGPKRHRYPSYWAICTYREIAKCDELPDLTPPAFEIFKRFIRTVFLPGGLIVFYSCYVRLLRPAEDFLLKRASGHDAVALFYLWVLLFSWLWNVIPWKVHELPELLDTLSPEQRELFCMRNIQRGVDAGEEDARSRLRAIQHNEWINNTEVEERRSG